MSGLPKVFVFCNECAAPDCHSFVAIAEDGTGLAGHVCSHHDYAAHDMGVREDGWKRDKYAEHYPSGFVVEYVEVTGRASFYAACRDNAAFAAAIAAAEARQ